MSRLALLIWVAALTAAAYPTWDTWRPQAEEPGVYYSCFGHDWDESPSLLQPLRGDLATMTELSMTWAVPALVVLAALGRWNSAAAGRRAAAILTLIAFVRPLTPVYAGDDPCEGGLPLLSLDWFKTVACAWGPYELALLTAALLVLLATHVVGPAEEPVVTTSSRPAWHRGLTLLIDYLAVTALVTLAIRVAGGWPVDLTSGLLQWLSFDQVLHDPARLLVYPAMALYILVRWRFTRRPALW
ncbi:hypothetical protein [Nonomuraea guangzhouensis]|uniref:Uncharacterized protein n=1 Tax=Nonomuraea guangzhouensis TaxID=1291555 RepID=A0ABW4G387_9ACTN|nr:hypothetical protein [Nonomuraea guangzhouensis]